MHEQIAEIIRTEVNHKLRMPLAENLRAAAWYVMDEFPSALARDFGDAAVLAGLHRQGAINRWNEAKANLSI
ncbi:hypothetical protein EVC02_065 [Rhizobium phage RHph_N17]|nr:hypothetical protein EVC02_065 [Rhizobium phage RHph_N17]